MSLKRLKLFSAPQSKVGRCALVKFLWSYTQIWNLTNLSEEKYKKTGEFTEFNRE
jgi:hypothetical protein